METQRRTVTSKSGAVWAITHELIRPPKSWSRKTVEQRERAAVKLRIPSRKKPAKSKKAAAPKRKASPTKRKALPKGKPVLMLMARSSVPASAPAEQSRKRSKRAGSGQLAMF